MVTAYYSVCVCVSSPSLSTRTAVYQPAEPMQGRGVCWGAGVSKVRVRAHAATLSWAEMDAGEGVSCLSGTQIFGEETETAGAGDSARQNMKAKSSHDTWWTQTLEEKLPPPPPPTPHPVLAILLLQRHCTQTRPSEKRGKGKSDDSRIAVAPSWTLALCNVYRLMFPKTFRKLQRNRNRPVLELCHVGGNKKLHAARNPQASFKRDQGSVEKTAENNSEKWKVTRIER